MKTKYVDAANLIAPALNEEKGSKKWTAEVWRLDQINLNGRIYSTELAKKIIASNPTTVAYDGHDASFNTGAEYSIAKAVCSNPRIENHIMMVDLTFVDEEFENKLKELIRLGVPIGCSSVGYGETDESGVIIPESYELVRFLDFVTCPAGEVHAQYEHSENGIKNGEQLCKPEKKAVADFSNLSNDLVEILF